MISLKLSLNNSMYFCCVRSKTKEHSVKHGFSIFGLALLLLLSPCKVRHLIQDALGVPQTKVSNQNKAELNNTTCQLINIAQSETKHSENLKSFGLYSYSEIDFNFKKNLRPKTPYFPDTGGQSGKIPLYILYRHLKVHL